MKKSNVGMRWKGSAERRLLLKLYLSVSFLSIACTVRVLNTISWVNTTGVSVLVTNPLPLFSRDNNSPLIAIVSCTKSTKTKTRKVADVIERHLLPSIYKTITQEDRAKYRVELILGYDHDDEFWRQEANHHLSPKSDKGAVIFNDHEPIPIHFLSIKKESDRIPFNELCRAAFEYGATYIVRVNDDSEFKSAGWITEATNALASFSPPNVGVVGPDDLPLHQPFLTHDMVHAPTHYSIFDSYYPNEFDNYFVDNWISNVYGKERTRKLNGWEVFHHHKSFCEGSRCERYKPSYRQEALLEQLILEGSDKVTRKLSELARAKLDTVEIDTQN